VSEAESTPTAGGNLVMYCTPWCPDCARARAWLDNHGIAYLEVDVSTDMVARDRAARANEGRLHTPTFELGTEICVDFRAERLCMMLGIDGE